MRFNEWAAHGKLMYSAKGLTSLSRACTPLYLPDIGGIVVSLTSAVNEVYGLGPFRDNADD